MPLIIKGINSVGQNSGMTSFHFIWKGIFISIKSLVLSKHLSIQKYHIAIVWQKSHRNVYADHHDEHSAIFSIMPFKQKGNDILKLKSRTTWNKSLNFPQKTWYKAGLIEILCSFIFLKIIIVKIY